MSVLFFPPTGYRFTMDGRPHIVVGGNDVHVLYRRLDAEGNPTGHRLSAGIEYWNSKTRIARMATLRELGHR